MLEQAFFAEGNVATAGGCLAAPSLSAWILWRLLGKQAAAEALRYVAPVGEETGYIMHILRLVEPFIP